MVDISISHSMFQSSWRPGGRPNNNPNSTHPLVLLQAVTAFNALFCIVDRHSLLLLSCVKKGWKSPVRIFGGYDNFEQSTVCVCVCVCVVVLSLLIPICSTLQINNHGAVCAKTHIEVAFCTISLPWQSWNWQNGITFTYAFECITWYVHQIPFEITYHYNDVFILESVYVMGGGGVCIK